jgi:thiol:disulfide interchange protein DsbC
MFETIMHRCAAGARAGILAAGIALLAVGILPEAQAAEQKTADPLRAALEAALPDISIDSVRPSAVGGLYEVMVGPQLVYVSADGRYLIQGDITDLKTRKSITEPRRRKAVADAVNALGEDKMIIFGNDKAKYTVSVFTDIDCSYCRKLHSHIDQYIADGIRVRYLFFPRAGLSSNSYRKAVSVWCADDRRKALTDAKLGKSVPPRTCDNPVKQEYELGETLGIDGTPALVMPDGELVPGYLPPARLAAYLEAKRLGAH